MMLPGYIPSPSEHTWYLGPLPIRAYALSILFATVVAVWITYKRYESRGGNGEVVIDAAFWAFIFGVIGGRVYHVLTDPQLYFGEGRNPVDAFRIWDGGLGIWGAILFGAFGAWIACRNHQVPLLPLGDALAPGLLIAQGLGRLGNYFNQELFGRPTELAWGLQIDLANRPAGFEQFETFHPTFLYELIWNFAAAGLLILLDRRYRFTHGRAFALYLALYSIGRLGTESLRIDTVNYIGPFRLNIWTATIVLVAAVGYFIWARNFSDPTSPQSDEAAVESGSDLDGLGESEADTASSGMGTAADSESDSADSEDTGPAASDPSEPRPT